MPDISAARTTLVARILDGSGMAPAALRRAAFDNTSLSAPLGSLTEKVTKSAHAVTDEDIAAAKATGLSEDAVLEIVVCAAVGEATRQVEMAFAALAAVSGD